MSEQENLKKNDQEEIFSKALRAGRRTYFFDVRETRAGDFYLTITESKKNTNEDGSFYFKKHKIYLYKEDFESFKEMLSETTNFIIEQKGEEVISERHQKDFHESANSSNAPSSTDIEDSEDFSDLSFDDI